MFINRKFHLVSGCFFKTWKVVAVFSISPISINYGLDYVHSIILDMKNKPSILSANGPFNLFFSVYQKEKRIRKIYLNDL